LRQSDGKTLDIGVVQAAASPGSDPGGYADAAAQDKFCAGTYCWISMIYDQSPKHNDLIQAPRGGFSGPALGGFNTLPIADMAPITIMGHKLTLALEIGDVSRFQSVKQAVSYCGLCSAERSSADKLVRMPISKQRNKHIQQVLVEAAKLAPRYSHELALVYDRERQ
jgi:hypothetical protein